MSVTGIKLNLKKYLKLQYGHIKYNLLIELKGK